MNCKLANHLFRQMPDIYPMLSLFKPLLTGIINEINNQFLFFSFKCFSEDVPLNHDLCIFVRNV